MNRGKPEISFPPSFLNFFLPTNSFPASKYRCFHSWSEISCFLWPWSSNSYPCDKTICKFQRDVFIHDDEERENTPLLSTPLSFFSWYLWCLLWTYSSLLGNDKLRGGKNQCPKIESKLQICGKFFQMFKMYYVGGVSHCKSTHVCVGTGTNAIQHP